MTAGPVEVLRQVLDPCSVTMGTPLDIVEMGLVDEVEWRDGWVHVTLLLTDFSCPHYAAMRQHVIDVLCDVPGVRGATVGLATHALWTPDRIGRRM